MIIVANALSVKYTHTGNKTLMVSFLANAEFAITYGIVTKTKYTPKATCTLAPIDPPPLSTQASVTMTLKLNAIQAVAVYIHRFLNFF